MLDFGAVWEYNLDRFDEKERSIMTAEELWKAYITENNLADCEYDAWAFGVDADLLAQLVAAGEKTATASAYPLYEVDGEDLPAVGEYSVILDSKENAVCVIRTQKVTVVPFAEVTQEHAFKEGEGDKSLSYWRQVHEEVFTQWMEEAGLEFKTDMMVVCEEFSVVYR